MPFIITRDHVSLFCRQWAEGPPVLFVHGWAMSSEAWQPIMALMAQAGFQTIAHDRRGHGRSDDPGRGYDYDTLADDLATVLEALDLTDVTLVGHSMGAGEIARYLTRHGTARVARVVMAAPFLPFPLKTPDNPDGFVDAAQLEAMWALWSTGFPEWLGQAVPAAFGPGASPETARNTIRIMQQCSVHAAIGANAAGARTDFRAELPTIATPTLILQGDDDQSCPLQFTGRPTARLLANARLKVYPGANHTLILGQAHQIAEDIAAFIEEKAPAKVA